MEIEYPLPGIQAWTNSRGFRVIRVHYSADALKDEEWAKKEKKNYPDEADWDREYEISFSAVGGLPIYARNYNPLHHEKTLDYIPTKPLFRGWDFGYIAPAVVISQFDLQDRWLLLKELLGNNILLEDYVIKVEAFCAENFPGGQFYDFPDPSGMYKSDKSTDSSIEILKKHGMNPKYKWIPFNKGIEEINKKLKTWIGDKPSLIIDPLGCPITAEGFRGGYQRKKPEEGRATTDDPVPNIYCHPLDAVRYMVNCLFVSKHIRGQGIKKDIVRSYN